MNSMAIIFIGTNGNETGSQELPPRVPGVRRHEEEADGVGVFSSVTVAQAQFNDLLVEYWRLWCSSGDAYESFGGWLRLLKRQVTDDIASIWKGESNSLDRWYKRACGPAVEEALESLVERRNWAGARRRTETAGRPYEDVSSVGTERR